MEEREEDKLRSQFMETANLMTKMFKEAPTNNQTIYKQGQQDAYNELFQFMLKKSQGDLRNIDT